MSEELPRLAAVSLDCADPGALADFYLELLDGEQLWRNDESGGVRLPGGAVLVPQRRRGRERPAG